MLLIGIGNPLRRDDGAGLVAARRLRERLRPEHATDVTITIEHAECTGELTALLDLWAAREQVLVFDAASAPALLPGSVLRLDGCRDPLPSHPARSTHALGLAQAVELGRALGALPARLTVYAIGAADFGHGEGLSADAERGVTAAVEAALAELRIPTSQGPKPQGDEDA
ncbi:MAG: hydrogenase maturation protease [Polyangia bacterium]